jgi:predicted DNA-binding transcriptional regulator AlpA
MDYDDFTKVLEEFTVKIINQVSAILIKEGAGDRNELMTAKEVRAMLKVTDKTLFVWHKTGFLPRIRIGGVVGYSRADVERVAQVKGKD